MRPLLILALMLSPLAVTGCAGVAVDGGPAVEEPPPKAPGNGQQGQEGSEEETSEEEASDCVVTHFTAGGESRFRVEGTTDCILCPGPQDVITLRYSDGTFLQELVFDGALTNSSAAAADELILEQQGAVCWSEGYSASSDLPTASSFTIDGHASTIEFDKGPDSAGPCGTLSYYRNDVAVFAMDVCEGVEIAAYPDDGVLLN